MRIICPACGAVYEVPVALLSGNARALRCARCGNEWVAELAQAAPADPIPSQPLVRVPDEAYANGNGRAGGAAPLTQLPPGREPLGREPLGREPTGQESLTGEPISREHLTGVPLAPHPPADARLTVFPPLIERSKRSVQRASAIGWALTILLLLALAAAAYVWRAEVQAAWPPSQRAYATIGLR